MSQRARQPARVHWDRLPLADPNVDPPPRRIRPLLIAVVCFAVGAFLLSQGLNAGSPARDLLRAVLEEVRDPYWGVLYVLLAFAMGTLIFAPITVLFVATSLSVDASRGFAYCIVGGLFSASLAYLVGRRLGGRLLTRLNGRRFEVIRRQIATRPLRAVLIARFLPVGNFTLINLVLGGFHARFGAFILGTGLGMLPGALGVTLCKGLLESALASPDWRHLLFLALGAAGTAATFYLVSKRLIERRFLQDASPDASPQARAEPKSPDL